MIKFLMKKELLDIQPAYGHGFATEGGPQTDDALVILSRLRECPSYQMDSHHIRCGLRTRLTTPLSVLNPQGQVGICIVCWKTDQDRESWQETLPAKAWAFSPNIPVQWEQCKEHRAVKEMYTADTREWTPKPQ